MSTSNGQLVRVNDVDKVFRRGSEEIHVLSGLNLDIPQGDFLALMGRPGPANQPCST
jgi:putative ABC transport system ATP-binding protein